MLQNKFLCVIKCVNTSDIFIKHCFISFKYFIPLTPDSFILNHEDIQIIIKFYLFFMIISVLSAEVDAADWHHLRISEIMAEDGDYMDWIEIFNSGSQPVLLEKFVFKR